MADERLSFAQCDWEIPGSIFHYRPMATRLSCNYVPLFIIHPLVRLVFFGNNCIAANNIFVIFCNTRLGVNKGKGEGGW